MRTLLVFVFAMSVLAAIAQPTFESNNCFHIGIQSQIGWAFLAQSYAAAVENTGNNHTWDYSQLPWAAPTAEYVFQSSAASGNSTFADTEINEYGLATFPRNLFFTYSPNEDTLYYNGLVISSNYRYTPGIPYLTFPMNFGDSLNNFTQLTAIIGNEPSIVGSSTRSWKYDGYGTVQLPYGIQENVYRIKTTQIDSTYITNFASPYQEIIWFRASDGLPVLRFQESGTLISAYFSGLGGSTIAEKDNPNTLLVFPNPVGDVLHFKYENDLSHLEIFNLSGQKIMSLPTQEKWADVAELPAGNYLLKWTLQNNEFGFVRFTKE